MSKHTPGPWFAKYQRELTGREEWWILFDSYASLASVRRGGQDASYGDEETLEANARLIAAAPELLDILQKTISANEITKHYEPEFIERIRSVIAKATGGAE